MTKNHLQFFRVNISSANKVSGTILDGTYRIDLPEFLDTNNKDWQCAIEAFFTEGTPAYTFLVSCPQLTMGNNYSTTDGPGLSTVLFASTKRDYNRSVNADAFGFKVLDASMLRSQMINIKILDITGAPYPAAPAGGITGWLMTLIYYPWTWVDGE